MGQLPKHLKVLKVTLKATRMLCVSAILTPLPLAAQTSRRPAQTKPTQSAAAPGTQDPGTQIPGWNLKFAEECDGTALNYAKWSPHPPGKLILGGVQTWVPNAIEISGSECHILARKTGAGYTSGILTTFDTFAQTYGRFEIRFRMPAGRGLEPLFQLLPVPTGDTPSIDVMNAIGSEPAKALFANHWGDARADRDYTGSYQVADLSNGFHIVSGGVERRRNRLECRWRRQVSFV